MRSTVNLAVLGLVIERPSYGYELSQRFGRRFGDLLAVSRSHIYAALDSLQRDGLIEPLPQPRVVDRRRQQRIHYRVTGDGARTYREWVAEQLRENARRSQMLGRLAAVGAGQIDTIDLLLEGYEREARDGAAAANGGPPPGDGEAEGADGLVTRLLDEERRVMREARQTWIAFARRELSTFDGDGDGD